ncbi:MAG: hypothetical protein IPJ30_13170 [Acidobacteria bacterium]|nr:hypothetical protein [Acidobacteriota bacterium]
MVLAVAQTPSALASVTVKPFPALPLVIGFPTSVDCPQAASKRHPAIIVNFLNI